MKVVLIINYLAFKSFDFELLDDGYRSPYIFLDKTFPSNTWPPPESLKMIVDWAMWNKIKWHQWKKEFDEIAKAYI